MGFSRQEYWSGVPLKLKDKEFVCVSCHNKVTQTEWLQQQMFTETRRQRPRCQQGWFLLRARGANRLDACPGTYGGLLAVFGGPWAVETSPYSLASFSYDVLLCVFGSKSLLSYKDMSKIRLGAYPTIVSLQLNCVHLQPIITNCNKDHISK